MSDHLDILKGMRQSEQPEANLTEPLKVVSSQTQKCPFCAEDNSPTAVACVHCGEYLNQSLQDIEARPWVRYWARYIDTYMYVFIPVLILLPFVFLDNGNSTLLGILGLVFLGVLFLGLWIPVEAFLLSTIGTTPGKWLLRVKVRNADGSLLSFKQAIIRALKVWLRGEGLRIPLVCLFTYINGCSKLNSNKITSWDREGSFQVTHENIGFLRGLVATVAIIFFAAISSAIGRTGQ